MTRLMWQRLSIPSLMLCTVDSKLVPSRQHRLQVTVLYYWPIDLVGAPRFTRAPQIIICINVLVNIILRIHVRI